MSSYQNEVVVLKDGKECESYPMVLHVAQRSVASMVGPVVIACDAVVAGVLAGYEVVCR